MVEQQTPQEIERRLKSANAVLDTLAAAIGPTCGFTASECAGGGWVIFADGRPYAACTEAWEVPEIMGRVMASKFGRSFRRPEQADDVTPYGTAGQAPPDGHDHHGERLPRMLRPVPREPATQPTGPLGARLRDTTGFVLAVLAAAAASVWGA